MTDPSPGAEPPAASSGPAEAGKAATEAARSAAGSTDRVGTAVPGSRSAQAAGAAVGRMAARFGGWLTSIGWGKFVVLAFLFLAFSSLLDSTFRPPSHSRKHQNVDVDVKMSVDSDGLHIAAAPDGQAKPAKPKVQIDDKGVRIESHKNGRDSTVVIDRNGVRVEEARGAPQDSVQPSGAGAAPAPGKAQGGPKLPQVTLPPAVLSDPDKVAEAVEAAKGEIEDIVKAQVDRKVAALPDGGQDRAERWIDLADFALMAVFVMLITKIALGSKRRAESRAEAADAVAAEEGLKRQLAEAQLKTMQAQVEPHFLFNTLASVDYLIETDPARASRMQKNLIQYLRAALPQMRQASSTLGQEMALCRSYLEILKVRMDDRLQFAITLPAGLSSAAFAPMMLQTLVENAIKHGLEPKPEGGALTLSADVVDGNLRVTVSDTGLGFGAAGLGGGGVGLNNVRERLRALFGTRGRLTIEPYSPSGTIATIVVPYTVGAVDPPPQASPQPA
jgi:signal transduction histidine kinase